MNKFLQVFSAAVVLALAVSCGKQAEKTTTGVALAPVNLLAVQPGTMGSPSYAEVLSSALPVFESDLQAELSRLGVVGWQARADCKEFARMYVAVAQARYANAAFYSFDLPPSLAIAEVWYHRSDGKSHAAVLAMTDQGPVFIEPQTGATIVLSPAERASINFCRW